MLNPRYKYQQEEGRKEGIKEGEKKLARKLLKEGIPLETLIKTTGLTESQILNEK